MDALQEHTANSSRPEDSLLIEIFLRGVNNKKHVPG